MSIKQTEHKNIIASYFTLLLTYVLNHSLKFSSLFVHLRRLFGSLLITLMQSKDLGISDSLEIDCSVCVCFHMYSFKLVQLYSSK